MMGGGEGGLWIEYVLDLISIFVYLDNNIFRCVIFKYVG